MQYQSDLQEIVQSLDELKSQITNKKFFITGGTGFLGRWLVDTLLLMGAQVSVLTRSQEKTFNANPEWKRNSNLSLIAGALNQKLSVNDQFETVIHAANDLSFSAEATLKSSQIIFNFAKEASAKTVLFLSSGAVYHLNENSKNPYGEGKLLVENEGIQRAQTGDFEFKIARCFAFLGPHQDLQSHFAAAQFFNDVIHGKTITIQGDGSPMRSFLYPTDFVVGAMKVLFQGRSEQAYDLGSSEAVSILELANLISEGRPVNILNQGSKSLSQTNAYLPNLSLLEKDLGFKQKISLKEAIRRTHLFYKANYKNP